MLFDRCRPHHAEEVYVTGTFDNWTKSERLELVGKVFEKTVTLPESSDKIFYKVGDLSHSAPLLCQVPQTPHVFSETRATFPAMAMR
jgi:hypothetical protein